MVTAEELVDDQDYQDILEDIREECEKYGGVDGLRIPRPGKCSIGTKRPGTPLTDFSSCVQLNEKRNGTLVRPLVSKRLITMWVE